MFWDPEQTVADFLVVAALAGIQLAAEEVEIEKLTAPHRPPTKLPPGKMAVYVFSTSNAVLKVGKVGAKSSARYTYQHYRPTSARSTLASSMLSDTGGRFGLLTTESVGDYIKQTLDRVNLLIPEKYGVRVLSLLEVFLHCRLEPKYEGFKSQSAI